MSVREKRKKRQCSAELWIINRKLSTPPLNRVYKTNVYERETKERELLFRAIFRFVMSAREKRKKRQCSAACISHVSCMRQPRDNVKYRPVYLHQLMESCTFYTSFVLDEEVHFHLTIVWFLWILLVEKYRWVYIHHQLMESLYVICPWRGSALPLN